MSTPTVPFGVRLPADVRAELDEAAEQAGVTVSALAARLITEGLAGDTPGVEDGEVVAAIDALFASSDADDPATRMRRVTVRALARVVETGGPGAASAATRLLAATVQTGATSVASSAAWAPFRAWLATPTWSACPECHATLPPLSPTGPTGEVAEPRREW